MRIVVIGGSAGGIQAVSTIVKLLTPGQQMAMFVVIHLPSGARSVLPKLLSNMGAYPALHPYDGMPIEAGRIYVAPPDYHLLVERGVVRVTRGPKENRHRPAIDPLFGSAARAYGSDVVGVILSGSDNDGSAGLAEIKAHGGVTIAQDPDDAIFTVMPRSALERGSPDCVVPVREIGPLINRYAAKDREAAVMQDEKEDGDAQALEAESRERDVAQSVPSAFACPDCGGVLWEVEDGEFARYRCRVGHGFTPDGLMSAQSDELERALWQALKSLEERTALLHRLANRMEARGTSKTTSRLMLENAAELESHAEVLRGLLQKDGLPAARELESSPVASGEDGPAPV